MKNVRQLPGKVRLMPISHHAIDLDDRSLEEVVRRIGIAVRGARHDLPEGTMIEFRVVARLPIDEPAKVRA